MIPDDFQKYRSLRELKEAGFNPVKLAEDEYGIGGFIYNPRTGVFVNVTRNIKGMGFRSLILRLEGK